MRIFKKLMLVSLLSSIHCVAYAEPVSTQHTVVAPKCLLKNINATYATLSSFKNLTLIETNDAGIDALIAAKQNQTTPCGGFMDVTHEWKNYSKKLTTKHNAKAFLSEHETSPKTSLAPSYSIKYPTEVATLTKLSNPQNMWTRLQALTSSYKDRYSRSDNGLKVANEIKAEVEAIAKNNGRNDVSAYIVETGGYKQPSVVVKIGTSNQPGVVVGAHMDTLSSTFENKPGADDDGTGTVTVLEVARTILSSGMHFNKPVYLIWYAAEEMGLVGSQYVVSDFKQKNIPVSAVMQLDMTGYAYQNNPTMWLYDDYTNKELTAYVETLIGTYVKAPVQHDRCGYACSDHASWTQKGYNAVMPFEASFRTDNPDIHTSRDTMEKLSLAHMTDYLKLALAFTVELAEPVA